MSDPPLVYVAGPFSAKTREGVEANIRAAVAVAIEVAKAGAMPVTPHANTSHPDFEAVQPYPFWIAGTMALCRACDAILMIPGWDKSSGARGELEEMRRLGRRVFFTVDEVSRWVKVRE